MRRLAQSTACVIILSGCHMVAMGTHYCRTRASFKRKLQRANLTELLQIRKTSGCGTPTSKASVFAAGNGRPKASPDPGPTSSSTAQANHINSIENFWNQAKRHMRKFNGVPKEHFGLFLKECEWRFNNSDPSVQLLQLRQWVRSYLR